MNTTYLVSSIVWSVIGFASGYGVGRAARMPTMSGEHAMPTSSSPRHHLWSHNGRAVFGVLLLVLLTISAISIYLTLQSDRRSLKITEAIVACQAEFNERTAAALLERSDSAATERQAQRDLLLTLVATEDEQESQDAIQRYLNALDAADAARAANPLPGDVDCRREVTR